MTNGEAVNWLRNIAYDTGKAEHRDLWHYQQALFEIVEMLEGHPERKKGRWILQDDKNKPLYGWHLCSECGSWIGEPANFCSVCGADMRGVIPNDISRTDKRRRPQD